MPTILRIDGLRVIIYPNDHQPPHVHIMGADQEAIFNLECADGQVSLRGSRGFSTAELNRLASILTDKLSILCMEWERIHGHH